MPTRTNTEANAAKGNRDLIVWQKSMKLVTDIYRVRKAFPKDELYGLTSRIRRSAVLISSNLADGHGRTSCREFRQFVGRACGSLVELEIQLEIARNLDYLSEAAAEELLAKASGLLNGLRKWSESQAAAPDSRLLT